MYVERMVYPAYAFLFIFLNFFKVLKKYIKRILYVFNNVCVIR